MGSTYNEINRQGSVLSRLSDYDVLDVIQNEEEPDEVDETLQQAAAASATGVNNFLVKNRDIIVQVSVRESHGFISINRDIISTARLYDLECTHSGHKWHVVRKYNSFEELHRALRFYRAALILSRPTADTGTAPLLKSDAKKKSKKTPPARVRSNAGSIRERRKVGIYRRKSLKFPSKPEMFVSSALQVEKRRVGWVNGPRQPYQKQLEIYINAVLQDPLYRNHEATMNFLEISSMSFTKNGGEKYHEGHINKRSGGRKLPGPFSCLPKAGTTWNKRWLVLKDSYICYLRSNQQIADLMLFDQDFDEVRAGFSQTRVRHGLIIANTVRELALKTTSFHKTRNWVNAIERVAESCEYIHKTKHQSFAPTRTELAHWYVDASSYFSDIASALEHACEEIFITDWWLTPELFLRRPVVHMTDDSRLDRILHKKAKEGVKVYILLYKEIEMAVGGIQSMKAKNNLENLHPNILVMRHPDHIKSSIYLWTHHEKTVVIDQRIAFLGGLDLCFGRWDDADHRLTDLGSVQTVTPPVSRPVSRPVSTSVSGSAADAWKGIGLTDLQKLEKNEQKGSKYRLNSRSDTQLKDYLKYPLVNPRLKFVRSRGRRRHHTESETLIREAESYSEILNIRKSSKPRSYSVNVEESHSDTEVIDDLQTVKQRLLSPAVPSRAAVIRKRSRSAENLISPRVHSDIEDEDEDVFGDEPDSVLRLKNSIKSPHNSKLLRRQDEVRIPDIVVGNGLINSNEVLNEINGKAETNDEPEKLSGGSEVPEDMTNGDPPPVRKNGVLRVNDISEAQQALYVENNPSSAASQDIDTETQETNQIKFHISPEMASPETEDEKRTNLPFGGNGTVITVESPHSTTSSISSIPTFNDNCELQGIRRVNTEASDGFSIQHNTGSNNNLLSADQAEVPRKLSAPETSTRKGSDQIKLEPIRGFSIDESVTLRKKSRGKTPNPPPISAFKLNKALFIRQPEVGGLHTEGAGHRGEKSALKAAAADSLEEKEELIVPENTHLLASSFSADQALDETDYSQSIMDLSNKRKSWKKIRSSMDKVKIIGRHEAEVRRPSIPGSPLLRRESSGSVLGQDKDSSSKYWMGKDYVNWIFKDLDTAKRPFNDGIDRFMTVRMPWHDIACVVFNKAATDVARHFIQRWNHAKKVKASSKTSNKYPLLRPRSTKTPYKRLPPFIKDLCELVNVQILRSCPGWACGAEKGERSIYNAYMDLIENSEHYIYIENQFFISWCGTEVENCICEALVNRILRAHADGATFRVYIVLPLLPAFEADLDPQVGGGSPLFSVLHWIQQSLSGHDNSLFKKLYSHGLDPNCYVSVGGLRQHGVLNQLPVTELIYVHSKLMIVDDKKCIIGSANINDRSLSGERDSEMAALIEDELFIDSKMSGEDYQAGKFCFSLRNNLFQEHLGLRDTDIIQDITCEEFYKNIWFTTAAINTAIFEKVFCCLPSDSVKTFEELRAYRSTTPPAVTDPVISRTQLTKVKGHLVMYPLNFLRDEILINHAGMKQNMAPSKFWT